MPYLHFITDIISTCIYLFSSLETGYEWVLEGVKGSQASNTVQLHQYSLDIASVFFSSLASVRLNTTNFSPDRPPLDSAWMNKVNQNEAFYEKRALIMLEELKLLAHSQRIQRANFGPAALRGIHGIQLLLDRRGTSEQQLDELARRGVVTGTKYTNFLIYKLADLIDHANVRRVPPDGMVSWKVTVADNANKETFASQVPAISIGTTELPYMPKEEFDNLKLNYLSKMPGISEEICDDVQPTKGMNDIAEQFLLLQDCAAFSTVYHEYREPHFNDNHLTGNARRTRYEIGDAVILMIRNRKRDGRVTHVANDDDQTLTIDVPGEEYSQKLPSREVEAAVVEHAASGNAESALEDAFEEAARSRAEAMRKFGDYATKEYVEGKDDGGGREKTFSSTTVIDRLLTDFSSKHDESSDAVLKTMSERFKSEEEFKREVQPVSTDQEFITRFFRRFFSSLKSEDDLPIIPVFALGHSMKSVHTTFQTHLKALFDSYYEVLGISIESPEYNRLRRGRVMREQTKAVLRFIESLRYALVKKYLDERGATNCILDPDSRNQELVSPFGILNEHFDCTSTICAVNPWRQRRTEIVLSPNGRLKPLLISDAFLAIGRDFATWMRSILGDDEGKSVTFGPVGVIVHDPSVIGTEGTPSENPLDAEDVDEALKKRLQDMPFEGSFDSIMKASERADIVDRALSRSRRTYEPRLYLYERYKKAGFSDGDARDRAREWTPGIKRKMPDGISLNGLIVWRLVRGSDGYVMLYSQYLSRRVGSPSFDTYDAECTACRKNGHDCQCKESNFEKNPLLVFLVALGVNVHSRQEVHYQQILAYQLLFLSLILKHGDAKAAKSVLQTVADCCSLTESGESFQGEPADMNQERTNVQVAKSTARDANKSAMWEARAICKSAIRTWGVIKKADKYDLGHLTPYGNDTAQIEKETRLYRASILWATDVVRQLSAQPSNDNLIGPRVLPAFTYPHRIYWAPLDAQNFLNEHVRAIARGYDRNNCAESAPSQQYPPLRTITKRGSAGSKSTRNTKAAEKKAMEKRRKEERLELADKDGKVDVEPGGSIAVICAKEDRAKSESMLSAIFSTVLKTNAVQQEGDDERIRRPLTLTKSVSEAQIQRDSNSTPCIVIVDLLFELKYVGGGMTWIDHSRKTLRHVVEKYASPEVKCIVMCLNSYDTMNELQRFVVDRDAAELKKGIGSQDAINALGRARQPQDQMPAMFATLARSQQSTYMRLLAEELYEQMTVKKPDWDPSDLGSSGCGLFLVGGSKRWPVASIPTGRSRRVLELSSSVFIPNADIKRELKPSVNAGDGLSIMFSAARTLLSLVYDKSATLGKETVESNLHFFVDDENRALAMASYLAYSLDLKSTIAFKGSLYIRAKVKSIKQLLKISVSFRRSLDLTEDTDPSGDGLFLDVDVMALQDQMKQAEALQYLQNEQLVAVFAAGYALIHNDVLKMEGHSFSVYLKALMSLGTSGEAASCSPVMIEPLPLTLNDTDSLDEFSKCNQLSLFGAILVQSLIALEDKATRAFLTRKYPPDMLLNPCSLYEHATGRPREEASDDQTDEEARKQALSVALNPDYIIAAASKLCGSSNRVPDPLAKLLAIGACNAIFREIVVNPYLPSLQDRRRQSGNIPFGRDSNDSLIIEHNFFKHASPLRAVMRNAPDYWATKDEARAYLEKYVLMGLFKEEQFFYGCPRMCNPLDICIDAAHNDGMPRTVTVPKKLLYDNFDAHNMHELQILIDRFEVYFHEGVSISERTYGASCIQEIILKTVCSHTAFNERGNGTPLLVSNTPKVASAGSKPRRGDNTGQLSEWDGLEDLAEKKFEEVFLMLSSEEHCRDAIKLCKIFCKHMFDRIAATGAGQIHTLQLAGLRQNPPAELEIESMGADSVASGSDDDDADDEDQDEDHDESDDETDIGSMHSEGNLSTGLAIDGADEEDDDADFLAFASNY